MRQSVLNAFGRAIMGTYPCRDFGFHVWPKHVDEVLEAAHILGSRLRRHGITFDRYVVQGAILGHDAGSGTPFSDFIIRDGDGYRPATCGEEVAAVISGNRFKRLQAATSYVDEVVVAIWGTNPFGKLPNIETKLVSAADLYKPCAGTYEEFVADCRLLHLERERMEGVKIPFASFVRGAMSYLGLYMARTIEMTPEYGSDGQSVWHREVSAKIARLVRQQWRGKGVQVVAEWGTGPLPVAALGEQPLYGDNTLQIMMSHDQNELHHMMSTVKNHHQRHSWVAPITVALPTQRLTISLNDGLLDRLTLPIAHLHYCMQTDFQPTELARVLDENGLLHLADVQRPGNGVGPYLDEHDRRPIDRWLDTAGFRFVGTVDQPYGQATVYARS